MITGSRANLTRHRSTFKIFFCLVKRKFRYFSFNTNLKFWSYLLPKISSNKLNLKKLNSNPILPVYVKYPNKKAVQPLNFLPKTWLIKKIQSVTLGRYDRSLEKASGTYQFSSFATTVVGEKLETLRTITFHKHHPCWRNSIPDMPKTLIFLGVNVFNHL